MTQTDFRAALMDATRPVPPGLTDGAGHPAGRRFAVYRNNVAVSLTDALQEGFPAIRKLIGDENFHNVAGVFLRRHPPDSPLLMFYGQQFATFLAGFPPLAHLPYLADVARLEQAMREVYHAADATAIDPGALGALPPESLAEARFTLAPSVRVLRSDWPVHAIWAYNCVPNSPKPEPRAQDVLITRPEFDPVPVPIAPGDTAFISALMEGSTLGVAAEAGAASRPDFDLSHALGLLLSGGALTSLKTGDQDP
ncbi:MAG: DNA-binding domain-containing protein [Pseudomonadota bacterium]